MGGSNHLALGARAWLLAIAVWTGGASGGQGAAIDQLPVGYVTEFDPVGIEALISDGALWKPVGVGTYIVPERTLSIVEWCRENKSGHVRVAAVPQDVTISCGNPTHFFRRAAAGSIRVPQIWWDIFNRTKITRPTITSQLNKTPGCIGVYASDFAELAPLDQDFTTKAIQTNDNRQSVVNRKIRELIANRVLDATASDLPNQPVNTNFSTSYLQTITAIVGDTPATKLPQKGGWYTPSPGSFDSELKETLVGKTIGASRVKVLDRKEWSIDEFGISPNPFNNLFGNLGDKFPKIQTDSRPPAKSQLDEIAAKLTSALSSVQDQYRLVEQVVGAGPRDVLIIPDDALDGPSWAEIRDRSRRVVAVVATYGGFPVFPNIKLERGKYLVAVHRSAGTRLWQLSAVAPAEIPAAPTPNRKKNGNSVFSTTAGALLAVRDDKRFLVEGLSRGYKDLDTSFYGTMLFDLSVVNVCSAGR
jgi:hypothetical protein